jgi:hypothetical protein
MCCWSCCWWRWRARASSVPAAYWAWVEGSGVLVAWLHRAAAVWLVPCTLLVLLLLLCRLALAPFDRSHMPCTAWQSLLGKRWQQAQQPMSCVLSSQARCQVIAICAACNMMLAVIIRHGSFLSSCKWHSSPGLSLAWAARSGRQWPVALALHLGAAAQTLPPPDSMSAQHMKGSSSCLPQAESGLAELLGPKVFYACARGLANASHF